MSDTEGQGTGETATADDEAVGAAALAYAAEFAERLGRRILDAESPEVAARVVGETLLSDVGAIELLHSAFEEGREDAMLDAARYVDATGGDGRAKVGPRWDGVRTAGERAALYREGHLCGRCELATMCVTARAIQATALTQVSRCLAYREPSR